MGGEEKRVAIRAAKAGGEILRNYFQKAINARFKGPRDIVTDADLASEKTILSILRKEFPDYGILAEESGKTKGRSEYAWVIDPLDGTTNFSKSIPFFCVAIGLVNGEELQLSAVYMPVTDELFFAEKGKGAFLNGKQIHVSTASGISNSFLFYCHGKETKYRRSAGNTYARLNTKVLDIKRPGAAELELAYVACGRADAFFVIGTHPWDITGGLLVEEAGGKVTELSGKQWGIYSNSILASNGKLHEALLHELSEA